MKQHEKTILIFIGKGKSGKSTLSKTIAHFCKEDFIMPDVFEGTREFKTYIVNDIKKNCESGLGTIINLQDIKDLKKVPLSLRRRALVFEINKIII